MNKSYKVVFSKARGAMMVVNELTSPVQGKAAKTVVAAAVAAVLAGPVLAGAAAEVPAEPIVPVETGNYIGKQSESNGGAYVAEKDVFFQGSRFEGNTAAGKGGALYAGSRRVLLQDVQFKNNASNLGPSGSTNQHAGGALMVEAGGKVEGKNVLFSGNSAVGNGGAVAVGGGVYAQEGGSFTGNKAAGGGAVAVFGGTADFVDVDFRDNTAQGFGGAVMVDNNGSVEFAAHDRDVVVSGNKAGDLESFAGKKYAGHTGGFLHLKGKGNVTFDVAEGRTMTIGAAGSDADSITSYANGSSYGLFKKTGDGRLVVNSSMAAWTTDINVEGGTLEVKGPIGTYDQHIVASKSLNNIWGQTVTVKNDAAFVMGDQLVNRRDTSCGGEGFSIDLQDRATFKGGVFTIDNSKYVIDDSTTLSQEGLASITVGKDAKASVDGVVVNAGTFKTYGPGETVIGFAEINGGRLATYGGTMRIAGKATAAEGTAFDLFKGTTLATGWENLVVVGEDGHYKKTGFAAAIAKGDHGGTILETNWTGSYTLDQLGKAKEFFGVGDFVFENALLKTAEDGNVAFTDISKNGGSFGASTVKVGLTQELNNALSLGAFEVDAGVKSVAVTGEGELTLVGAKSSGRLIEGVDKVESLKAGKLVLGTKSEQKGTVNADLLEVGDLTVNGAYDAAKVEVTGKGSVEHGANFAVESIKLGTEMTVDGMLTLKGASGESSDLSGGKLTVNGVVSTDAAAAASYADASNGVFYVDRALKLDGAKVVVGSAAAAESAGNSSITVDKGGLLVVDASKFIKAAAPAQTLRSVEADDSVFGKNTEVKVDGTLELVNLNRTGVIALGQSVTAGKESLQTNSIFFNAAADGGAINVTYADAFGNAAIDGRLAGLLAGRGLSGKEASILDAIGTNEAYRNDADGLNAKGKTAFEQAAGGNVTAGVFNVAYDANAAVTDAIIRHQLEKSGGMGAWADVVYASNEAKSIYGSSGYEADISGAVFGFDATLENGLVAGAAVTVGKADADSVGGVVKNSLDSDFWGVSLYASKDYDGLNVKADLGYMSFDNDFSGLGDASDAKTITAGLRGDFAAYESDVFKVVPHIGVRYTRIETDAVAFNKGRDMNVFEAPIGVKVSGSMNAAGWNFAPAVDVTLVPQLGDKAVSTFASANDVAVLTSSLVNTTVGVSATKGAFTLGLGAGYGFGSDDRSNTQINAGLRYAF